MQRWIAMISEGITTTAKLVDALKSTAAITVVAAMSKSGIEEARGLAVQCLDNPSVKDTIKRDFSQIASTLELTILSVEAAQFIHDLTLSGVWKHLSPAQRGLVITGGFLGVTALSYIAAVTGQEKQTLTMGVAGFTGALSLGLSRLGMYKINRSAPQEELLPVYAEQPSASL